MPRYLTTIQYYAEARTATDAETLAITTTKQLEASERAEIQTCVVQKAPFRPLGEHFIAGVSCEADIQAEESE